MGEAIILTKAAVIIGLCIISYHNSINGDLVHDDIFAIRTNQDVYQLDTPISNLLINDFWGKPMTDPTSHKSYRPLTVLTFRLNYALDGFNPFGYHLVNIVLHVMCVLLLWCVCVRIVFTLTTHLQIDLGFLTAALFAVHPVHTEAVSGVVGRAEILACIFFLSALLLYCPCCSCTSTINMMWIAKFVLSQFFGICAMLCKENGLTIFGLFILYDMFINIYQKRTSPFVKKFLLMRLTITTMVTIISLLFRLSLLHNQLPLFSVQDNPASFSDSLLTRLLTYNYLLYFNTKLLVAPIILCYDWQMNSIVLLDTIMDARNIGTVMFYICLVALLSSVVMSNNKFHKHVIFMSLAFAVIPFLPASNLFIRVGFVVAERVLYIPSIGYCILVVYGTWLIDKNLVKVFSLSTTGRVRLSQTMIAFLVVFFSWRTFVQNPVWANRESLFVSGVHTVPGNAKVHYNYANFLKDTGRMNEAIYYYNNTILLCNEHASAHNNLGTLLDGSEAAYHFQQAIKYNPQHYRAYYNLGNYHWDHHNEELAINCLRESIRINPNFVDSLLKLSHILSMQKKNGVEAESLLKRAMEIKPNDPDIINNYGVLLNSLNRTDNAIEMFLKVVEIAPNHSFALAGLGRTQRMIGNTDLAEELLLRSLSIRSDSNVYQSLGALYFNTGRIKQSIDTFHHAVQADPNNVEAVCKYIQVLLSSSNDLPDQELTEPLSLVQEALKHHPNEYCVLSNLARLHSAQKDYSLSITHSSRAIELASNVQELSDAYVLRARIYKDSKRLSESLEDFKKAVEGIPEAASLLINIGGVYHLMGDYDSAETNYKKALLLEPNNVLAKTNLKKLKRLHKSFNSNLL